MPVRFKILLYLLFVPSCLSGAEGRPGTELTSDSASVLTAVHSTELRGIMARLNRLSYEQEYTELELDRMRAENIEALVDAALQLNRTADRLPDVIEGAELNHEERVTFKAMAGQLHRQTVELRRYLETGNYATLETGYRQLRHTCNACHNLFRDR